MVQPESITVYTDGAARSNPGPAAIGYVIYDRWGILLEQDAKYVGRLTNNEAEYEALLWAMDQACGHCRKTAMFHSDSELVVRQIKGEYRAKKKNLLGRLEKVLAKKALFEVFDITHVPRTNRRLQTVDKLVNDALNKEGF
jgi:ribonuclease HI